MAFHCREEARDHGSTDLLGRTVRDALGGVGTVREVLAMAAATSSAGPAPTDDSVLGAVLGDEAGDGEGDVADAADASLFDPEAARLLRTARRARDEALRSAAARESA
jgi:hypothetical protein